MSAKAIATAPAAEEEAETSLAPATRESVMGAKLTIATVIGFCVATVIATVGIMVFVDARMDSKVAGVREDMSRFREDVKDGLRDLKDEVRLLRDVKK